MNHGVDLKNFQALVFGLHAGTHRPIGAEAATGSAHPPWGWLKGTQLCQQILILFQVVKSVTSFVLLSF